MKKQTICILGASGFVGTQMASRLSNAGQTLKLLTRKVASCQHLSVLPNCTVMETNIHDEIQLEQAFKDVDVVVNLVGILNERQHNGDGFRHAHVELARKILNACHHQKITRLLQMSALNADASAGHSHYLRTKGEAENMLHAFAGHINVTSFRPSVIFGEDDSFFNRFAALLELSPLFFPLACANARFAPVYVGDVVDCFIKSINDPSTYNQRYDICGPEIYTLKQLVEYTSQQIGRRHWIMSLPNVISRLQANLLEYAPGKPFSVDNYQSLKSDSICAEDSCHYCESKQSLKTIVPWYLGERRSHNRDNKYRQVSRRG